MNTICLWLVIKGYTIKQTKIAIWSYHVTLSKHNKSKEYQNFYIKDLSTHIFIILDALAYGVDILDIIHSIIYNYYPDKSLNIILQQFGQAT